MIRWKYVMPRLVLVLMLWLAIRYGLDPLLRVAIVANGEATVGAKVELSSVRSLLLHGELELQDLRVANPRKPMRNLLESNQSRLQVDLRALLNKRLVINDGTVRGLRFDTPRDTSGQLDAQPIDSSSVKEDAMATLEPWFEAGKKLGTNWIDGIHSRFEQDLSSQLEIPRVVKQLEDEWPKQAADLRSQIEAISAQARQIAADLREARKNPLRNLQYLGELQKSLVTVQQKLQTVTEQLQQLPKQANEDRRAVLVARQHDEQRIRNALHLDQIDGSKLSEQLLGPMVSERLKTVIGWARMAREIVPGKSSQPKSKQGRGVTIHFVGQQPQPAFLIKRLELSGTARLGGQLIELVGTLTHATNEPSLLTTPTRLRLQSDGSLAFTVDVALDRRDKSARDEIHLACPRLLIPGQKLGQGALAMQLSPGTAEIQADMTLDGDRLTGHLRLVQSSVLLRHTGESNTGVSATESKLTSLLEQTLAGIEQLDAQVRLSGTLDQPEWYMQSNLGPQLAHGFNQAAKQLVQKQASSLLASSQQKADTQLAKLAQLREKVQQQLLAKLGESGQLVEQLAKLERGGLAVPQLSSPLQFGTQRK